MCGIYGIVNGVKARVINQAICKYAQEAMVTNSIRGMDSTGIFQIDQTNYYHKDAVSGSQFTQDPIVQNFLNDADRAWITVVHNRAATEGKVKSQNAHPFECFGKHAKWLLGVHNGTLTNWKSAPGSDLFEVDSEWALSRIAEDGEDALKRIQGAYAFVWYEGNDPHTLHIVRNYQRPMFVAYVKNADRMLFASEYQMITWLAERNNIDLDGEIIELQPQQHYRFNVENPREFTRALAPSFVTVLKDRMTEVIETFVGILKPASTKPAASLLTPPPASPSPDGVPFNIESVRMAKLADVYKKKVNFIAEMHDSDTKELWGTVRLDGCLYSAVMRNVETTDYRSWRKMAILTSHVIGAFKDGSGGREIANLALIVSKYRPNSETAVAEEESEEDLTALREAIANSIEVHMNEKADNGNAV